MRRPPASLDDTVLRVVVVDHTAELAGGEVALARLLHEIDRERYDVRVLVLADGPLVARLREDGIHVAVLRASGRLTNIGRVEAITSPLVMALSVARTLRLIPRLASALRGAHADLVVANTLKSAVLVSLAAPLARRRWVWHLHDRIARDYLPNAMVTALRTVARFAPSAIIANSRATRETLPGVADCRIVVAYPGLDTHQAVPRRQPTANPSFGLLGRIAPTKGQLEFVRAAALLAPSLPDAMFSVIGDSMFNDAPFAAKVRALPAALGVADRVVFTGWAADPTAAIANLTALVHASPVPEPFGQVLVEAMLAGVPVVATNAGGVPEILDPDHCGVPVAAGVVRTPLGLLVEPADPAALADAMRWVIEHPDDVAAMALRARASATARFDIRLSARHTECIWTRAVVRG